MVLINANKLFSYPETIETVSSYSIYDRKKFKMLKFPCIQQSDLVESEISPTHY